MERGKEERNVKYAEERKKWKLETLRWRRTNFPHFFSTHL